MLCNHRLISAWTYQAREPPVETTIPARESYRVLRSAERNLYQLAWVRFRKNRLATLSLVVLIGLSAAAILAPVIAPYDPNAIDLKPTGILQPPSLEHLFGTDDLGRDAFSRAVYGARISLSIGFIASGVAVVIGVLVGATAAMAGGWLDNVLMRSVDILLSVPLFFLIMISQTLMEPSIFTIMAIIGITSWMDVARLVRGDFLSLRSSDYVTAAVVAGATQNRIARRHILPNVSNTIIVAATLRVAQAILIEAALSFVGLGVQPPNASWGSMLQKGLTRLLDAPWLVWFPGILISVTVLAFNFVGDGLRDALDPKQLS
jgi:peptide/nickel transport system permease protein